MLVMLSLELTKFSAIFEPEGLYEKPHTMLIFSLSRYLPPALYQALGTQW